MDVTKIEVSRAEAREHYEEYRKHRHFEDKADAAIKRAYRAIAQGSVVIQALKSIVDAGVDEQGRPRLAIARADEKSIECHRRGGRNLKQVVTFTTPDWQHQRAKDRTHSVMMDIPLEAPRASWGDFPNIAAIVPIIPLPLRPTAALSGYHILWEADWREVPRDPFLLKYLGSGDLWLVCAAWDLTEVEYAALQSRVRTN